MANFFKKFNFWLILWTLAFCVIVIVWALAGAYINADSVIRYNSENWACYTPTFGHGGGGHYRSCDFSEFLISIFFSIVFSIFISFGLILIIPALIFSLIHMLIVAMRTSTTNSPEDHKLI